MQPAGAAVVAGREDGVRRHERGQLAVRVVDDLPFEDLVIVACHVSLQQDLDAPVLGHAGWNRCSGRGVLREAGRVGLAHADRGHAGEPVPGQNRPEPHRPAAVTGRDCRSAVRRVGVPDHLGDAASLRLELSQHDTEVGLAVGTQRRRVEREQQVGRDLDARGAVRDAGKAIAVSFGLDTVEVRE